MRKKRQAVICKGELKNCVSLKCKYCRLKKCLSVGMTVVEKSREAVEYTKSEINQILNGNYSIEVNDDDEEEELPVILPPTEPSPSKSLQTDHKCTICRQIGTTDFNGFYVCQLCVDFFQSSIEEKKIHFCSEEKLGAKYCYDFQASESCSYCRMKKCLELGLNSQIGSGESWSLVESAMYSTDEILDILEGDSALDQLALEYYPNESHLAIQSSVLECLESSNSDDDVQFDNHYEACTIEEIIDENLPVFPGKFANCRFVMT